jgi:hypothetical protein
MKLRLFAWLAVVVGGLGINLSAGERIVCEGDYERHLQGVAVDAEGDIFWSFTTALVKTDAAGKKLIEVPVADHHGDVTWEDGVLYVAVNLGQFNEWAGKADSWIYLYDSETMEFLSRQPVPEVVHGAGGMAKKDGHYFVVGGLPDGVEENYIYEYDEQFRFVERHKLASGWTLYGIQTAEWHDDTWWFGCYGYTRPMLKADGDFRLTGYFLFDFSLGIVGVGPERYLVAEGPKTPEGRCLGNLRLVKPDPLRGMVDVEE